MQQLACVCYIDNGKEYLLLHRNKKDGDVHKGKWIGVGGKVEKGETPEECIVREVYEETGLVICQPHLKGMITFPEFTANKDWYVYVFVAKEFSGNVKECDEGTLEWVPYSEVLQKPTWAGDLVFLEWLLTEKPFFSAKFLYDTIGGTDQLLEQSVVWYS